MRKLKIIETYCKINLLNVIVSKTKISHFKRGRPNKAQHQYNYDNNAVEKVQQYTYLGIPFSSSGVFLEATKTQTKRSDSVEV